MFKKVIVGSVLVGMLFGVNANAATVRRLAGEAEIRASQADYEVAKMKWANNNSKSEVKESSNEVYFGSKKYEEECKQKEMDNRLAELAKKWSQKY